MWNDIYQSKTWFIFPTWRCNLNCIMCFPKSPERSLRELEISDWLNIVEFGCNFAKHFDIGGGEPFLKNGIGNLLNFISESGCYSTVTTNGIMIDTFLRTHKLNASRIEVSIESFRASVHNFIRPLVGGSGSFHQAMKGLKTLVNLKQKGKLSTKIGVAQVMLKHNMHDFPVLVQKMGELGVDYIYSQPLDLIGRGKKLLSWLPSPADYLEVIVETIEALKKITNTSLKEVSIYLPHPYYPFLVSIFKDNIFLINEIIFNVDIRNCNCKQYDSMLEIEPNGNINGCYAQTNMLDTSIGNILDYIGKPQKFQATIKKARERYIRAIRSEQFECKTCKYYWLCKGGCRANALSYFGSIYKRDPRCPGENYTIPESLKKKAYYILNNTPIQRIAGGDINDS